MAQKKALSNLHLVVYLLVFFAVWTVRELVIRPLFLDTLDGIIFGITESGMKLLVWTWPALLLIRYYRDDMWIGLKEMFTNKPEWYKGAPLLAYIILAPLAQALMQHGEIAIRPDFMPASLIEGVLFVGITEEVVFRGFLLNAFLKKMKMRYAIALDSLLFALIHYPIWMYRGFDLGTILVSSLSVAALSAVFFAYPFIKTKSIFVPIALHMTWNLLLMLFVV